jgi:hypothetical protein
MESVTYERHWIYEETKSLQRETITEQFKTWMVYFPQGHSIRFVGDSGLAEMTKLGFHLKPRLVDMETGDVVDSGGDPYDFGSIGAPDELAHHDIILDGDSEEGDAGSSATPTRRRNVSHDAT